MEALWCLLEGSGPRGPLKDWSQRVTLVCVFRKMICALEN